MLLATISLTAQERTEANTDRMKVVTGRVIDAATGQPLAGVIVSAYGNQRQTTMTDETGSYELHVPEYTRSVMMRIDGYALQQRAIAEGKADACLYSNAFSATYKTATSAVLSAEANQFDNTSEFSIDPLISQRLGGDVRTASRSGIAGMGNTMFINGFNSLNANAPPLVVIDDVLMDMQYSRDLLHDGYFNNLLANLNVNDIESVQVLKNGTALYGAKGANGVIVIKTKRNKSMATKIDVTINGQVNDLSLDGVNKGTNVKTGSNGVVNGGGWHFYLNGLGYLTSPRRFNTISANTQIMSDGSFLLMSVDNGGEYGAIAANMNQLSQAADLSGEDQFAAMEIRNGDVYLDETEQALVSAKVPDGWVVTEFDVQVTAFTVDDDGNLTGEYEVSYTEPVKTLMNVSGGRGQADIALFGLTQTFARTATTEDLTTPFNTETVMWIETDPDTEPFDYRVVAVSRTINQVVLALAEVETDAEADNP